MKKTTIGFVGKVFNETAIAVKNAGYKIVLFHDEELLTNRTNIIFDETVLVDFTNELTLKKSLKIVPKIDALVVTYEKYIVPRALLAKVLGLAGPDIKSAEEITDKFLQRKRYLEYNINITPKFSLVLNRQDIEEVGHKFQFPIILKPTNLMKSLLVSKCDSKKKLINEFQKSINLISNIYKQEGVNRTPQLIVEEFLKGTAHSIELFVDKDGNVSYPENIVDVIKANEIGTDDNYEYVRILPSRLSDQQQKEVIRVAVEGIKALEIRNTTAHAEIIVTNTGPKIIEINGRLGGYRDRMYRSSFGIDLQLNEINLYLGHQLDFQNKHNAYTAVFELFPYTNGKFVEIKNLDEINNLKSLSYFSCKSKPGDTVGLSREGFRAVGVIMISNLNNDEFQKDFKYITENVSVIVN